MLTTGATLLTACASRTILPTLRPAAVLDPAPVPSTQSATSSLGHAPSDLVKHIVIFIQENHTFDSLFANFPGQMANPPGRLAPMRCPPIHRINMPTHLPRTAQQPTRRAVLTQKRPRPTTGGWRGNSRCVIGFSRMCAGHRSRTT
jgi:hypothetical protein